MSSLFVIGGRLAQPGWLKGAQPNVPKKKSVVHRYMDNTRISDFRTCPRYYWIRHVKHWRPELTSVALVNGSCWHEAMNAIWPLCKDKNLTPMQITQAGYNAYVAEWVKSGFTHPDNMSLEQIAALAPRGPQIAKEILFQYVIKRRDFISQLEILDIERPFAIPLLVDEDGTVTVYYVGRLDKTAKHPTYGTLIFEHKTTSWYATNGFFRQEWLDSFSPNSQVDGYIFSAQVLYEGGIKGVWVDAALFHKKVFEGIKFIPIDRQFEMIDNWLDDTFYWVNRIKNDTEKFEEQQTLEGTFPKNTGSCGNYGGCPYRDICRFYVDPSTLREPPPGFKVEPWNPFDVLKLEKLELAPEQETETKVEPQPEKVVAVLADTDKSQLPLVHNEPVSPRLVQVFEEPYGSGEWFGTFTDGSKRSVLITEWEMDIADVAPLWMNLGHDEDTPASETIFGILAQGKPDDGNAQKEQGLTVQSGQQAGAVVHEEQQTSEASQPTGEAESPKEQG